MVSRIIVSEGYLYCAPPFDKLSKKQKGTYALLLNLLLVNPPANANSPTAGNCS